MLFQNQETHIRSHCLTPSISFYSVQYSNQARLAQTFYIQWQYCWVIQPKLPHSYNQESPLDWIPFCKKKKKNKSREFWIVLFNCCHLPISNSHHLFKVSYAITIVLICYEKSQHLPRYANFSLDVHHKWLLTE